MEKYLQLFILIPVLGFLISLFLPRKKENLISMLAFTIAGVHLVGAIVFIGFWLAQDSLTLDIRHITLFQAGRVEIFIDFYFDKVAAVFGVMGSILFFVVVRFSKFYLHREEGFKRYFTTILLFFTGYNLVIFSGNYETMFIGWELLGICSYLLIAFYRDRYLPVKNSLKVISIYRLGDVCLMLSMWMGHHLWHENITFLKLNDASLVSSHFADHYYYAHFIALMLVIAAAAKSAQLPFSSWLPRAMEGPTTSSAIFYGSLSVHLGIFLLLRTHCYWEGLIAIKVLIIVIGIATAIISTMIAQVQASVKTRIAYESIAQIGLMLIEIALGWHMLALVHFAGNAFLRTYQLLVSPSVLGYMTHDLFFSFDAASVNKNDRPMRKLRNSLYILSVKEWNLDYYLQRFLWNPFKWLGNMMKLFTGPFLGGILVIIYIAGIYDKYEPDHVPEWMLDWFPTLLSLIGLIYILKSFAEKGNAIKAWAYVLVGQLFIALSVDLLNEDFALSHIALFLGGSMISALVGFVCLKKIKNLDQNIDLNQFHGYLPEKPMIAFVFLLSCFGFVGLPFTPSFIGIDLLFSHIHKHEEMIIVFTSMSFLVMEVAILRIYSRVFLGPNKKASKASAYRSS
jgi:NADH-quinone oxidoreductase subunit L